MNKILSLFAGMGIGAFIFMIACIISGTTLSMNAPKVDLPEEYKAISKESCQPTLLQGYFRNDSLIIEFPNK